MSDNDDTIVEFPQAPELLVGPFQEWRVVVDGRFVPRLDGRADGDDIWLTVDRRFTAKFPKDLAYQAAALIAEAMAICSGYPHFGADSKAQPFAPIAIGVSHD